MIGLYFSGTGNSRYCLEQFLCRIGEDIPSYSIEDDVTEEIKNCKDIVFSYPVYYSDMPKIVSDFIIENAHLWSGKRIFVIATMGLFSGDGAGVPARLLRKYGATISGGLHLRMPDCIGDSRPLKKSLEGNSKIIENAVKKIDNAADNFRNGKPAQQGLSFFSMLVGLFTQRLYFHGRVKNYTQNPKIDSEKCIGCRKCENVCPMHNIHIENSKAVAGKQCTTCYRCFSVCPKKAITLLGKHIYDQHRIELYTDK